MLLLMLLVHYMSVSFLSILDIMHFCKCSHTQTTHKQQTVYIEHSLVKNEYLNYTRQCAVLATTTKTTKLIVNNHICIKRFNFVICVVSSG